MAITYYMQPSFAGGEFDPKVWGRVDNERYASGLRKCENFFIHKFGSVSNRPGFLYLGDAKLAGSKCRLLPFVYSDDQAYVMEFGNQYLRIWNSDGTLVTDDSGNAIELETPYLSSELGGLRYTQSADMTYFVQKDHPPMVLARNTLTSWSLTAYSYKRGPFLSQNLDEDFAIQPSGTSGSVTLTASKDCFSEEHIGSVWRLDQNASGETVSISISTTAATSDAVFCGANATWRVGTHGTDWVGYLVIERSYDGTNWMQLRSFKHNNSEANTSLYAEETEECWVRIRTKDVSSGSGSAELSVDPYVNVGYVTITAVANARSATATVDSEKPVRNTTATDMWWEAAWSKKQGYPASVCFYGDRLCFGGTYGAPRSVWMSKTADYYNFEISSPTSADDDSIQITLTSRKMSIIHTMVAMRQSLVVFSEDGVNAISYSGSALTPSSISQRAESYYGAKDMDILTVGAQCIYVQETGGAVRDIGYDYVKDAYSGQEISLFSAMLVNENYITETTYQQSDDSILWCVRDDGVLLSCTYMPEQKMIAWSHHVTDGEVESICCIPYNNDSRIWAVVKRTVNGNTVRYIERLSRRLPSTDPADQLYLDCASVHDGESTNQLYVPQLTGCTVGLMVDGNVMPDTVVGDDGYINTGRAGKKIAAGLKYKCRIETNNIEMQGMVRGSMQGHKVHIGEVVLRLLNSRGGRVGQKDGYLDEWQRRTRSDYLGNKMELFTGDVSINGNFTCEDGGRIIIEQDTAMPMTILGIMMGLSVSDA